MDTVEAGVLRLIAGAGRSGTTWLLDALAVANQLRPVFEPLHPDMSEVGRRYASTYLTEEDDCTDLRRMLTAAANGSLKSVWTDYRMQASRLRLQSYHLRSASNFRRYLHLWKKLYKRYRSNSGAKLRTQTVVKCIRANLMLDWIRANFDARIILLIRHPGAVVESRLRLAERWDPSSLLAQYRNDRRLCSGPLKAFADACKAPQTVAEALTAIWCIETLVPASQAAKNNYLVVFYEDLLGEPEREWRRIADALHLTSIPDRHLLDRPSQQAAVNWKREGAGGGADYMSTHCRWRSRLTAAEIRDVDGILQAFDIDFYSLSECRPDVRSFARRFDLMAGEHC